MANTQPGPFLRYLSELEAALGNLTAEQRLRIRQELIAHWHDAAADARVSPDDVQFQAQLLAQFERSDAMATAFRSVHMKKLQWYGLAAMVGALISLLIPAYVYLMIYLMPPGAALRVSGLVSNLQMLFYQLSGLAAVAGLYYGYGEAAGAAGRRRLLVKAVSCVAAGVTFFFFPRAVGGSLPIMIVLGDVGFYMYGRIALERRFLPRWHALPMLAPLCSLASYGGFLIVALAGLREFPGVWPLMIVLQASTGLSLLLLGFMLWGIGDKTPYETGTFA